MNHTTQIHNVDKVEIFKTTQNTREGIEKIKIITDKHEITLFGSKDEESSKEKTIELEVTE